MAKVMKLRGENLIGVRAKPKEVIFPETTVDQIIVDEALQKMLPDALKDITDDIDTLDGKVTGLDTRVGNNETAIGKLAPAATSPAGSSVAFTSASPLAEGVTLRYGTLSSISFDSGSYPNSSYESTIYFTSGSTKTTLTLPSGTKVIGDIDIEANTDYIMVVRDGNFVMAPINTWTA